MSVEHAWDAIWAALALGALVVLAASHRPGAGVVRLSALVRRAEAHRALYLAIVLGWMWLGWHFFAR